MPQIVRYLKVMSQLLKNTSVFPPFSILAVNIRTQQLHLNLFTNPTLKLLQTTLNVDLEPNHLFEHFLYTTV